MIIDRLYDALIPPDDVLPTECGALAVLSEFGPRVGLLAGLGGAVAASVLIIAWPLSVGSWWGVVFVACVAMLTLAYIGRRFYIWRYSAGVAVLLRIGGLTGMLASLFGLLSLWSPISALILALVLAGALGLIFWKYFVVIFVVFSWIFGRRKETSGERRTLLG